MRNVGWRTYKNIPMQWLPQFLMAIPVGFWGFVFIVFSVGVVHATDEVSCQCEPVSCGACEVEDGLDFYSAKCGPRGAKTKSCKRPLCRPVENQNVCLSKLRRSSASNSLATTESTTESPVQQSLARAPASTEYGEGNQSAEVVLARGSVSVVRLANLGRAAEGRRLGQREAESEKSPLREGERVQVGDRILTGADGRVRLRFAELSEIFVSPNSGIVVEEALLEKRVGPPKRTIIIDLKQGRLRSRVQGRYDDGESRFQVKTRSAVAGVRGTDFVVSFYPGEQDWKTEVHTLSGQVCFGRDPECEKPFLETSAPMNSAKSVVVGAGLYASYVSPAPPEDATPEEAKDILDRGLLSPLFRMTEEDFEKLKTQTDIRYDLQAARGPSAAGTSPSGVSSGGAAEETCSAPAGAFNKCSWSCEGNPKGASSCRTDLPGVHCVRRLCRANGQWAEPSVLPARRGAKECESVRSIVKDCGVYW